MKNSKRFLSLLILFLTVAMFSIVTVTASEVSTSQKYMPDNSIQIEAKYKKTSQNKITFNANGGKIGSKKTIAINLKKGSKIKKLPSTPKRTGYTFKGWYSKKSGGTKISANTKPNKSVTYFAQWKEKPRVLNVEEKKLVGSWSSVSSNIYVSYTFNKDGTYLHFVRSDYGSSPAINWAWEGIWRVSGKTLYMTDLKAQKATGSGRMENGRWVLYEGKWEPYPINNPNNKYNNYKIGVDEYGTYLQLKPDEMKRYKDR